MTIIFLLLLNILFVLSLWHMDVNHNLDRLGEKQTRGISKMSPERAYRLSQYVLISSLILIDILFVLTFLEG